MINLRKHRYEMPWGAAAAVGGAYLASEASGDAADTQAGAAGLSNAEAKRQYDQTRQDQEGYRAVGGAANNKLAQMLGLADGSQFKQAYFDKIAEVKAKNPDLSENWTPTDVSVYDLINANPEKYKVGQSEGFGSLLKKFGQSDLDNDVVYNSGLKFGLDQGTGAINQRALQSGGYDSGGTLKALTQYANDYGSTKANDSYNRYNADQTNVYNRLAGISGTGQQATNQVQAAGQNMTNQVSSNMLDAGNARAAGIVGSSNAWGQGLGSVANIYTGNNTLKGLLGNNSNNGAYFNSGGMGGFGDSYSTSYGE